MLVQFMLKNVLSFKEETILDLTAINAYKEHPCNLIDIGGKENFSVLRRFMEQMQAENLIFILQ